MGLEGLAGKTIILDFDIDKLSSQEQTYERSSCDFRMPSAGEKRNPLPVIYSSETYQMRHSSEMTI